MREEITKALQTSHLLASDLWDAHKRACQESPVTAILILQLLTSARELHARINELEALQK